MKKNVGIALLASAALAFGGIFVSCSGDSDTETKYVDKTYAAEVTFDVKDDAAGTGKTVTLATTTTGATIHYTTGGQTPTSGSATYSAAISVTADTVIKAIAVKDGIENSPISVASISIKTNTVTVYKDSENAVGSEITIDGTKYYVISNQLSSVKNASRAAAVTDEASEEASDVTGLVDTGDEEADMAIEKFASDVYVRKFLAEVGITKYIQVWNPAQKEKDSNATSANGIVEFSDKFPILDADKNTIAEFQQFFVARYLLESLNERGIEGYTDSKYSTSRTDADKNAAFNAISEADLRTYYEPSKFRVVTFPSDVSSKVSITKRYGYDTNGEVALTKTNLEQTDINKDYQTVTLSDGKTKDANSYVYTIDEEGYRYNLVYVDANNSRQFYTYQHTDNYTNSSGSKAKRRINVYAKGDPLKGDFNSSNFQSQVDIRFGNGSDEYDTKTPWIQVEVKGTNATALKYKILPADLTADGNWLDTVVTVQKDGSTMNEYNTSANKKLSEVLADEKLPFKDYISYSEARPTVNGYTVPGRIYIKAIYSNGSSYTNSSTYLNKDFSKVTLVPDTSVTTGVVYKEINRNASDDAENVPAFVNIYSANFAEIIAGTYSTSTPTYSVSFFNPANATTENAYPNLKASAGADDYSALAEISDATFAWGSDLAGIVVGTAAAAAPTVSAPEAKTIQNVITGAQFSSQSGKLDETKDAKSSSGMIFFSEKDADVAVLTFTVKAKKDLSLLSISDSVYFNKSRNFYTVITVDDQTVGEVACDSNGVASSSFSLGKKSLSTGKTTTVKIIVRGARKLYASQLDDFTYRAIFTPVTLTFKEINAGVTE